MQQPRKLLSFVAVLAVAVVVAAAHQSAADFNRVAIEKAGDGDMKGALKMFKKAVKLSPDSDEYLNNLGVAQMRLALFDRAQESFERALELNEYNKDASANLDVLDGERERAGEKTTTKKKKKKKGQKKKKKKKNSVPYWKRTDFVAPNPRTPMPRIPISELYLAKNRHYALGQGPFILTGAMANWTGEDTWTPDFLAKRFPDAIVDFYPHNMDKADTHPFLTPLPRALSELYHPTGEFPRNDDYPGTYLQWNVNGRDWDEMMKVTDLPPAFNRDPDWIKECLSTSELQDEYMKKVHWRMALYASEGAGMFNHQDVLRTSSWQAQILGSKRWHICAPDQSPYLYGAGKFSVWEPDMARFPLFRMARCFEGDVMAGDMVYYPLDYWHQTVNLETPSLSVSSSICDEGNWREIMQELKNECDVKKFNWQFSEQLCEELPKCWRWWERRYGRVAEKPQCAPGEKEKEEEEASVSM